jgi:hypothetical protein
MIIIIIIVMGSRSLDLNAMLSLDTSGPTYPALQSHPEITENSIRPAVKI